MGEQMSHPTPNEVKQARLNAGLTQQSAADTVHVSIKTWQKWEAGTHPISGSAWELFKIKTKRK